MCVDIKARIAPVLALRGTVCLAPESTFHTYSSAPREPPSPAARNLPSREKRRQATRRLPAKKNRSWRSSLGQYNTTLLSGWYGKGEVIVKIAQTGKLQFRILIVEVSGRRKTMWLIPLVVAMVSVPSSQLRMQWRRLPGCSQSAHC